jgi:glycerol uptake facilitator protein/aquaporin Z
MTLFGLIVFVLTHRHHNVRQTATLDQQDHRSPRRSFGRECRRRVATEMIDDVKGRTMSVAPLGLREVSSAAEAAERPSRPMPSAPTPTAVLRCSSLECFLTFALLFGVTTIVRWVVGPSSISEAIPQIHLQLLVVGAGVGLLLVALIISPPGKASGGHINPAISLAMWRFGVFPGVAVVPYIAAQLIGSLLGVLVAQSVWGSVTRSPPVNDAVLRPGDGWTAGQLFGVEAAGMAAIVFLVGLFLRQARLTRFTPWLVGFLIGAAIALLGTATGGSVNPARQFGPAVASQQFDFLWVYLIAPMVGALVAAAVLGRGKVATAVKDMA